jgi:hypothetical protein
VNGYSAGPHFPKLGFRCDAVGEPREGEAMRISIGLAAVVVTLGLASSSPAQQVITFGFGNLGPTQNVPITVPPNTPIASPQTATTKFSLASFFPKLSLPFGKALFGQSNFPTPKNLPGREYLKAFGYARPGPIGP